MLLKNTIVAALVVCSGGIGEAQTTATFLWPQGKVLAISLSFDDARMSQVDIGTDLLDKYDVKATFYVVPAAVEKNLKGWKKAVQSGHEIGNHTVRHPCTGNLEWSRNNALENYTVGQMKTELLEAQREIEQLLGVEAQSFAYPCGQTFVGRGTETETYIPVVADMFSTGRGSLNQGANDPLFCDFSNLIATDSDGKDFQEILVMIESARSNNQWIILAGHEIGDAGTQTTRTSMLKELLRYANDPANGIWIAPIGTVAKYVAEQRKF
jgi:peptidoglycan/xylan/chitin deacetylase (PgdA/CDA1 family)